MKKESYKCPICRSQVTLFVTPSVAPTCSNPKHKSHPKVMKKEDNNNE